MYPTDTTTSTADEGTTFALPEEDKPAAVVRNYEQEVNLVSQLTPDEQKALCVQVVEDKKRDWDGLEDFRKRRSRQVELFAGIMPPKPQGHEKIAQIHLSIIAQAVLILHATIHGQLFPPTNYIYGARAVTPAATERVRRLGLHMNWQVTTRITEYLPANDKGMMQWLIYGNAFDIWYYDPIEKRPCYEFIHTDDLILPYTRKAVRHNLSDVPRFTIKKRKYQHEIEQLVDVDYYDAANTALIFGEGDNADKLTPSAKSEMEPMQRVADKAMGQKEPTEDPRGPRQLLEQHLWYKLPGEKRLRPVIATVDEEALALLRLVLREGEDPLDRARYNREKLANDAAHEAAMAQHDVAMQQHAEMVQQMTTPQPMSPPEPLMDEFGPVSDEMGQPIPDPMAPPPEVIPPAPPEAIPPPPEPPLPPPEPTPVRMIPVNWVTKYSCIPNPEGPYDFGVGYLLEGDNIAADTLMSQFVSALTMSLFPTFFYSQQAKMQRGDIELKLGQGNESPLPPEQLSKGFFPFQFPSPPNSVPKLIEQREEAGRQLVGASSILTGDPGKEGETATAVQLRNNAARMNLAEMGNRYNQARANSMKNLARLNATTMDPVEYFSVTMPGQQNLPPEPMDVAREDYLEDFQVTFHCDPRLASQPQRVQDAMSLIAQILAIPPGSIDPQAHQMVLTMAFVGYLRALDRDDMAAILEQAPPPQPPPPPGMPGAQPGAPNGQPGETPGEVPGPEPGPPEGMERPPGNAALPPAA